MSDEPVTVINFDIRCPAGIVGIVTPIDLWSDQPNARHTIETAGGRYGTARPETAAERRLQTAEYCLGDNVLNRTKSYIRPDKFRLVGHFAFDRKNLSSLAANRSVADLITWTLRQVYGHPFPTHGNHLPVTDVTVRLWQPATPTKRSKT